VITLALADIVHAANQAAETARAGGRSIGLGLLHLRLICNPGGAFSLGAGMRTTAVFTVTGPITARLVVLQQGRPRTPSPELSGRRR
jgi:hypothetical protein